MAYDVATYTAGEGHITFDGDGPVVDSSTAAPPSAAPASVPSPAPAPDPAATQVSPQNAWRAKQAALQQAKEAISRGETLTPELEAVLAGEQRSQQQASIELQVPQFVSGNEITPEREGYVAAFQTLAPQVGIDSATAQGLLDVAVDAAVGLNYQLDLEHAHPEDARAEMTHLFGEEAAKGLIQDAQRYVKARGAALADYLTSTGLGNDPSCLVALALAGSGVLAQTPAQAHEQITKLMETKEYARGDRLILVKIQALSRIAARASVSENDQLAAAAAKAAAKPAAPQPQDAASATDARAELAKMMSEKNGPLLNAGHKDHAAAVRRFHELAGDLVNYKRRADYDDLPLANKLSILQYELEIATTDEERAIALAAIDQMKKTIEVLTPKPAPTQDPRLPLGFHDYNR